MDYDVCMSYYVFHPLAEVCFTSLVVRSFFSVLISMYPYHHFYTSLQLVVLNNCYFEYGSDG